MTEQNMIIESALWKRRPKVERFGSSPRHQRFVGPLGDAIDVNRSSMGAMTGGISNGLPSTQSVLGKWGIVDSHDSISAAAEQSEREHLHVMVNKLTLENIELKTSFSSAEKNNLQLERKVRELDEELKTSKKQLNQTFIAEKDLGEFNLVRSDWAIESGSITSMNSSSITDTFRNINNQIKGPGIVIQLSTNPWQEDQESQALRELVNIFIGSMSPPSEMSRSKDMHGLGFALDVCKPKDSFDYQTANEDQYLLPVELSDIERLTAVMNTRKIVAKCDFEKELMALEGEEEEDPSRFYLDIHRTSDGNVCESDIENIITSLKFERRKNNGLLNAVKELEKQQYELTHSRRAALIHLERERTQNKRLGTVIMSLKQQKRLPLVEQSMGSTVSGVGVTKNHMHFTSSRWFLLTTGAIVQIMLVRLFAIFY